MIVGRGPIPDAIRAGLSFELLAHVNFIVAFRPGAMPQGFIVQRDTGAHFKAAQALVVNEFSNVFLAGLFLARRAPEASPI
jgi:hypothetical protein